VGSGGSEVGIAGTTEGPEIMVGGIGSMKGKEGSAHV
jgi:NAD(P)H-nitrite reductase large subunit